MTPGTDDALLLTAYLDGELPDAEARTLEGRLAAEAGLAASLEQLQALRSAIRRSAPKYEPSDAFLARIARVSAVAAPAARRATARTFDWRVLAATAVIACGVGGLVADLLLRQSSPDAASRVLVAAHRHALLAADPVEVASSDRHTVKPWFDAHLAISPPVSNLATDGFPLVGGRIETINGQRVPVLIYRRNKHLISVVAEPMPGGRDDGGALARTTRDGYVVLAWRGADFHFAAISDVAEPELVEFVALLRQANRGP